MKVVKIYKCNESKKLAQNGQVFLCCNNVHSFLVIYVCFFDIVIFGKQSGYKIKEIS